MRTLVAIEIRRFAARRLVRIAAGLAVLGILIAGSVTFARSHRADGQTIDRAKQFAVAECLAGGLGPAPEEVEGDPFFNRAEFCAHETFVADPRFELADFSQIAQGLSAPLVILALVLGASFVGAEWRHGTIATTLTWEPRRDRVLVAKALATAALAFAGAFALIALCGLALTPAGVFRGSTAGIDAAWFREAAGVVARASGLAAVASVIGLAVASVGRNTAAALGVGFAYFAVLERMLAGWRPRLQPWLFGDLATLFVTGERQELQFAGRSIAEAGLLLALYAAGALGIATALFRRRDVA